MEEGNLQQDSNEDLAKIENLEQALIQHIRTSGVRKPRETALIDEVMDIRRDRRRLFCSLITQLKSSESINKAQVEELARVKINNKIELDSLKQQVATLIQQKNNDTEYFDQRLQKDLQVQEEKLKFMERLNIDKIQKVCNAKIQVLEEQVEEAVAIKSASKMEVKEANKLAMELIQKSKDEMEKKCNQKILE
jgi:response regulator RpfG family c-di-GMP phosphodiesterase